MRRRLLTSTLGVALAAVLVFAAGLAISTGSRLGGLSPSRFIMIAVTALVVAAGLALAQARRLARPVRDLAKAADRVAPGRVVPAAIQHHRGWRAGGGGRARACSGPPGGAPGA